MKRYSQNNEQDIILKYFGDTVGVFADFGSNDGLCLSNTRALFERGWKGICVDASPRAFERLSKLYADTQVECYNVAIAESVGELMFHESGSHIGNGDVALVSTLMESERRRWAKENFETFPVETTDIPTLLLRSAYKSFDFISIDIEGCDLMALEQLDLTNTNMVCVEVNDRDPAPYTAHCESFGLKYHARTPENMIYAR
jgi:FkbM family methyltransferase